MRSPRSSTDSCRLPRGRRPEMEPFPDDIFNLADIVLRVAREDPERTAVIDLDGWESYGTRRYKHHTYAELSADAESVAMGLREMGIAELTRIVFMSPPSYETCVMGVALTRVGAFSIWIDPAVGYRNIAERLSRVKPEAFLGNALAHLGRITFGWGPRDLRKLVLTESPLLPGVELSPGFHPSPARDQSGRCEKKRPPSRGRHASGPTTPVPSSTPPAAPGRRNRRCTCTATSVRCSATRSTAGAGIRTTRSRWIWPSSPRSCSSPSVPAEQWWCRPSTLPGRARPRWIRPD
ncbi:hypothetical protein MHPYR_60160 [uncultured Mycobacterium sp.]|uniref:AMP-dependent synthetase/ligase domain-containing protein n=1 Tax=uncultured Mycobacterium sp. TaxID=171292 RepID=A0A1Y5PIY6_9MYCO|nr:hypothetical protein MHPYR_60160 [uncultured Mycobacterium sp.]